MINTRIHNIYTKGTKQWNIHVHTKKMKREKKK